MEPSAPKAVAATVKSADRALRLIELLGRRSPRRFTDLADELAIPKGSLHALIAALAGSGWVVVERERGVSLGYRAHALVTTPPDLADLVQLADVSLTRLRDDIGETSHLATLDGRETLYLASRYSEHALGVRFHPGRRLPAQLTALGKAMLATLPEDAMAAAMPTEYPTPTAASIADERALRSQLADVRARGYAEDRGESTTGVFCVAVAVGHPDLPPCALSCSVPVARMDEDRVPSIVRRLEDACAEIVARLRPVTP